MRRFVRRLGWLLLLVPVLACVLPSLDATPGSTTRATATPTPTPLPAETATPSPTLAPPATFTSTPLPSPTPSPPAGDPCVAPQAVQLFPVTRYAGDRISVDVDPSLPADMRASVPDDTLVTLTLADRQVFTATVSPVGLADEPQARFYWVADLPATDGEALTTWVTVTLSLPPSVDDPNLDNNTVVLAVPLQPRTALLPPEPQAQWTVTETTGFRIHYITGSAAERDLAAILSEAQAAYTTVTTQLGANEAQVDIYLLDRVVGQGGYASSDWVAVSYVDRKYSPVGLGSVLRHELTHRLDGAIGCEDAPSLMREGLAVALAGGHYRPEPLRAKAAALLSTTRYVPLARLLEDFYTHQHEVAYLEAAALVRYVVDVHGWPGLTSACRASSSASDGETERFQAAVASLGFEDLAEMEAAWQAWLAASPDAAFDPDLLALELHLMDTMRRYQAAYDPPAHFIEGILFSPAEGARQGIVADFVRSPRDSEPVALELVLAMAQETLGQQDTSLLTYLLESLDVALTEGLDAAPLVRDVHTITTLALAQGLEPYRLVLEESGRYRTYVLDRLVWPQQRVLTAQQLNGRWELSDATWLGQ